MDSKIKNIDYLKKLLKKDEIETIENQEEIMHLLINQKVTENTNELNKDQLTLGERVSDKVAEVAGSWKFIIAIIVVLAIWIIINAVILTKAVDPYPFTLLNLILSCIAALQAPIIMMSQNRQDSKDRIQSENDYKVDLKTELILEDLHKKIDTLLMNQVEQKKALAYLEKKTM